MISFHSSVRTAKFASSNKQKGGIYGTQDSIINCFVDRDQDGKKKNRYKPSIGGRYCHIPKASRWI